MLWVEKAGIELNMILHDDHDVLNAASRKKILENLSRLGDI